MTPSELAGRVPTERHEHYDADDNLTGYTVVIREPRMSDPDLAAMLGLAQFEAEVTRCGFHTSIANDPDNVFAPEVIDCPVCAGLDQWERVLRDQDEAWTKANPNAGPRMKRPSDGRYPYMRFLSPDEAARLREERGPTRAERLSGPPERPSRSPRSTG